MDHWSIDYYKFWFVGIPNKIFCYFVVFNLIYVSGKNRFGGNHEPRHYTFSDTEKVGKLSKTKTNASLCYKSSLAHRAKEAPFRWYHLCSLLAEKFLLSELLCRVTLIAMWTYIWQYGLKILVAIFRSCLCHWFRAGFINFFSVMISIVASFSL